MSPELRAFYLRLRSHAFERPHATALWGDGSPIDYAGLLIEIEQRRQVLRGIHVTSLALAMDNGAETLMWDLAALFEQIPCIILAPFFTPAQRLHCLQQSGVQAVLADASLEPQLEDLGFTRAGLLWVQQAVSVTLPAGTAKLTYTSGSTGSPKGVCLSAAGILKVVMALAAASKDCRPTHQMALLPLAVLLENVGCYAALYLGAMVSLPSQRTLGIGGATALDMTSLLGTLNRRRPDSLILVPQLLQVLVAGAELGHLDALSFRFLAVGGARVSEQLLQRASALNLPVYEGYGLSECASVVTLNRPGMQRPGSTGKPLPHTEVRLSADGEVLVRSEAMLGYLGDTSTPTLWWPTGDIGHFDQDGYLYLKGRKKNQFITSFGRNVNPEWVEAELTQGPVIAQAFVHGEALAHNHALLWPTHAGITDAQLQHAVTQANQTLPGYAQVHQWTRLAQPFTPDNGMLTANGRPRRDAILNHYPFLLTAQPSAEDLAS